MFIVKVQSLYSHGQTEVTNKILNVKLGSYSSNNGIFLDVTPHTFVALHKAFVLRDVDTLGKSLHFVRHEGV